MFAQTKALPNSKEKQWKPIQHQQPTHAANAHTDKQNQLKETVCQVMITIEQCQEAQMEGSISFFKISASSLPMHIKISRQMNQFLIYLWYKFHSFLLTPSIVIVI